MAALVTSCAAPAAPPPATSEAGAAPAAGTPSRFGLLAAAEGASVVVRYRTRAKRPGKGRLKRKLRLENTQVVETTSVAERDALLAELKRDPDVAWAEADGRAFAVAIPNDPAYPSLYGLAKLQAPAAWDVATGAGVTVAVVDTGVDATHPDLAGQVFAGPDLVEGDDVPQDEAGHGTHVAGTIAAIRDNAIGVVGVAPSAKVLAVRVLGADGGGAWSTVAEGILAAAANGAKVINLSLGGSADARVVREAVAQVQATGVLVVAAAGNDGVSRRFYPAGYPGVLAVGATNATDTRARFSNYGTWVGIAAPGDAILSTAPDGRYARMSGTSMASPHVAGAAAIAWSLRPTWTADQVKQLLVATGDAAKGFTGSASMRRVNVGAAVRLLSDATPPAILTRSVASISRSGATVRFTTNERATASVAYGRTTPPGTVRALATAGTGFSQALTGLTRNTTYYYQVTVRDQAGNETTSPLGSFKTSR
jgi:thermitase